ncbi:MAG: aspartyl protease family protein [Planctomycetota bacterium]|jgi:predicted aspartyl protease
MTLLSILLTLAAAFFPFGAPLIPSDAPVFVVVQRDGDLVVERRDVAPNETLLLECTADSGVVDVILPPGTGGSGSIATAGQGGTIAVHFDGDGLQATRSTPDGKSWQGPRVLLEDLRAYLIRVCLTAGDGKGWAFVISDYERVRRDDIGPVIDLFAGKVPLGPGAYSLYTDTVRLHTGEPVHGEAPLQRSGHLFVEGTIPGGGTGTFVLDTGGAMTAMDRSMLPEGTEVTESQMVQYSQAGRELLKFAPGGAGGTVQGVNGHADLPELRFGELVFTDASVAVFDEFPQIFDRPVVGILGLDQLRRARCATLALSGEAGTLRLGPAPSDAPSAAQGERIDEMPFTLVNGHLMVRAAVNDTPVSLILDTGSPGLLLDDAAATSAGVVTDAEQASDARGLDEAPLRLVPATAETATLGDTRIEAPTLRVGPLPVFDSMRGSGQNVGLLGNALLARFDRCEIDFAAGCVRLVSRGDAAGR